MANKRILSREEFLHNNQSFNHLNQSDVKLKKYINHPKGFYIGAGANDGISQEYTKLFEELLGWTGLLVEPSVEAYNLCRMNRPNDIIINCALVESDDIKSVRGDFDGSSMSSINGERRRSQNLIEVPARTLTSLLKEHDIKQVDFISLDVEGNELNVLKGFDFNIWRPKYILIEVYIKDREDIENLLSQYNYKNIENITDYASWNPSWDGLCEDFLYQLQ